MNLLTTIFSALLHIILVLVFEGVFLFAILYPILDWIVNYQTIDINNRIGEYMIANKIPITEEAKVEPLATLPVPQGKNPDAPGYTSSKDNFAYLKYYYDNIYKYNTINNNINNRYPNKKQILSDTTKPLIAYGAIDEYNFLNIQKNIPYIIYAILVFVLFIIVGLIIMISNKLNIKIDYKFSIINSIIVFILIGGYAGALLWYCVFSQSYVLNIVARFYSIFLDVYNSA